MSFTVASAAGLELADASTEILPVDFVSTGGGYTLVALLGWWQVAVPSVGEGLLLFMDQPVPRGPHVWVLARIGGSVALQRLSSHTVHAVWQAGRYAQDIHRTRYLAALRRLRAEFPAQEHIGSWLEYFEGRPAVDVAADLRSRYTAPRDVGLLPLHAADGAVVDVLAVDTLGTAEAAQDDVWLVALASQWVYAEGVRPGPLVFLEWAADQRPHGSSYPGTPRIIRAPGPTKKIAGQALAGIL